MATVNPELVIDRCHTLPAMSAASLRLVQQISAADYDLQDVERVIRADPALAAGVLRLANSAAYGVPGKEFDLSRSLARLGARRLAELILSQTTAEVFGRAGAAYGLRQRDLWRGGVGGAIAAERLAQLHAAEPGLCYVAALLRDIGKLVVEVAFGRDASTRVAAAVQGGRSYAEAEAEVFGVNHAELGAALAARWQLPSIIVAAIRHHHDPPGPQHPNHDRVIDIVHAADTVCLWAGLATGDDGLAYKLAPHVHDGLGVSLHEAESLIAEVSAGVLELERTLSEGRSP